MCLFSPRSQRSNMAALFGIHVGNTSACLAIWKDEDRCEVIANDAGDRVTPTIVQWTPSSSVVGRAAQLEHFKNESNTIIRNKQLLNEDITDSELNYLKSQVNYKINKTDKCIKYELLFDGKQHHISSKDVLMLIMKKLYAIAKTAVGGNKELNAVITVPLHFSLSMSEVIKEVVKKVGFNVLQVIDEPSSAALGAGLGCPAEELPYHCLIYRIGGATLDATVLLVQDGMFSILSTVHKYDLGGELFTDKLAEFLTSEFKRQYKSAELTDRSKYKLRTAAENVKQILSIQNFAPCSAESVGGGYDLNCSVSRARFENLIAQYLPDVISCVKEVLEMTGLSVDQIKKVILCGGSLKIPKLQGALRSYLTSADFPVNSGFDELISIGAAMQAGFCMKCQHVPDEPSINAPCLSVLLAIKVKTGEKELTSSYIVPEYSVLPLKKHYEFASTDKCVTATIHVIKKGVNNVGIVELDELEPVTFISVDLDINKDGKLLLTLANEASGRKNYLKYDLIGLSVL